MTIQFNKSLYLAVKPRTLKEFYSKVLNIPLPPLEDRELIYKMFGLGDADDYVGSDVQNLAILEAISKEATLS